MKNIIIKLAVLITVCSCNTQNPYSTEFENSDFHSLSHDRIILGDRLEDPYTVDNMSKALMALYPSKAERIVLDPTDLYVRFLPKSQEDYDRLDAYGINLTDHPLDYKIVREGDYYHDPSIDEENITWQYSVVPKDFIFPTDIRYEIIDECYIAENDDPSKGQLSGIDWDAVERESFKLTGNEELLCPESKGPYPKTKPQGRITIIDDDFGQEPIGVAGVKVLCNCFVKFASCFTDENGYYTMNKTFTYDIRYRLMYKNVKGFSLGFNLILLPASCSTLGKNSPEGVSVTIDKNCDKLLFARSVVNNAGYEYFSKCNVDGYQLSQPPANLRIWLFRILECSSSPMLQQGAFIDNTLIGEFLGQYATLVKIFLPDITIGIKELNDYQSLYNQAIHEMAHASHFMQAGKEFWDTYIKYILTSFVTSGGTTYGVGTEENHGYCEVGEMWAYYVSSKFNRERYSSKANFGGNYWFTPQILMNLDERGMDRFKIFKALTPGVNSIKALQDKLISLYPEYKSVINSAFNRYE